MKRVPLAAVVLSGVLLVAGCSGESSGTPVPETSGSVQSPGAAGSSTAGVPPGVPTVANPIDTSVLEKQPCTALTAAQLGELGIAAQPEPQLDNPAGPGCDWDAYDEIGLALDGAFITAGSSLAGSYAKAERGGYDNFRPTSFAGYPGYLRGKPSKDHCVAVVAVRDNLLYNMQSTVSKDSPYYGNPCEIAKKAAELAVTTMSGGS